MLPSIVMEDLLKKIAEGYSIPKTKACNLLMAGNSSIWQDRRQLSVSLRVKAKLIDRTLANMGLFDLEEKKVTGKALTRDYVRFSKSTNGNVKELFNIYTINSLLLSRKIKKQEKRKRRLRKKVASQ